MELKIYHRININEKCKNAVIIEGKKYQILTLEKIRCCHTQWQPHNGKYGSYWLFIIFEDNTETAIEIEIKKDIITIIQARVC